MASHPTIPATHAVRCDTILVNVSEQGLAEGFGEAAQGLLAG